MDQIEVLIYKLKPSKDWLNLRTDLGDASKQNGRSSETNKFWQGNAWPSHAGKASNACLRAHEQSLSCEILGYGQTLDGKSFGKVASQRGDLSQWWTTVCSGK